MPDISWPKHARPKSLWTEADFEIMGWHDARIYALAFLEETFEFALDIDYILEWVKPVPPAERFTFWVSPCTLVFENVSELEIDLAPYVDLTIDDISSGESFVPRNARSYREDRGVAMDRRQRQRDYQHAGGRLQAARSDGTPPS